MTLVLTVIIIAVLVIGGYHTITALVKGSMEKYITKIKRFTGDFEWPLVPMKNSNDPFCYGTAFQMGGFYVQVSFTTDYRDDGTFNWERCTILGINSWSGIELPLGTDLSHIYFNTCKLIKCIEGRGLKVIWYDYTKEYWDKLEKKVNVLNTCVNLHEELNEKNS